MSAAQRRWLQRDLLRRLLLPVLAIVLLTGAITAYSAHLLVEGVFDRWLLDSARALATQVRMSDGRPIVDLPPQSEAILRYDAVDRVYYEVRQGDAHIAGDRDLPLDGSDVREYDAARAYDGVVGGRAVRLGLVRVAGPGAQPLFIAVAETRAKRDRATRDLWLVLAPVAALVLAAAVAVALAVRRTVRPLERMAALWNERSHASLEAMRTGDVPRELLPFALALNDLLARVRELLLRERRFATTAAHQLRTPLAGLQLAIARAASCPDLASTRAALAGLEQATQRTARLLQQLLALSRLDPEVRGAIDLAPVDLVGIARDVGEAYMDAAIARGVRLELVAPPVAVPVQGQADLLHEALGNLVDNAIRYTPPGGLVEIAVGMRPPQLSVADSGPGIRSEDAERVFERFVRGDGTAGEGSGLGLAIVREIAALHRAEAFLDSSSRAQGSRFVLRFAGTPEAAGGH